MKVLNYFYLFISLYMSLFNTLIEAIDPQTLNISDVTKGICSVTNKHKVNGVLMMTYIAYQEDNITIIMDSGAKIWESERPGMVMRLLRTYSVNNRYVLAYMFYDNDDEIRAKYYIKRGYEWHLITISEFGAQLRKLETECSFDIMGKTDPSIFTSQKHDFHGLPAKVIISSDKIALVKITDDDDPIWERQEITETCTSVIVHGHSHDPQLVHINIRNFDNSYEKYFTKDGNKWVETEKEIFYAKLDELDNIEEKRKGRTKEHSP